jgi:hypothetical protein
MNQTLPYDFTEPTVLMSIPQRAAPSLQPWIQILRPSLPVAQSDIIRHRGIDSETSPHDLRAQPKSSALCFARFMFAIRFSVGERARTWEREQTEEGDKAEINVACIMWVPLGFPYPKNK